MTAHNQYVAPAPAGSYAAGFGPAPTGQRSWALGFLSYIPVPFFSLVIAAIVMIAVYPATARRGVAVATENARGAANWALTVLTVLALCALYVVVLVVGLPSTHQGFFPIGLVVIVVLALGVVHLVMLIMGLVIAGRGQVFRPAIAIPYLRPRMDAVQGGGAASTPAQSAATNQWWQLSSALTSDSRVWRDLQQAMANPAQHYAANAEELATWGVTRPEELTPWTALIVALCADWSAFELVDSDDSGDLKSNLETVPLVESARVNLAALEGERVPLPHAVAIADATLAQHGLALVHLVAPSASYATVVVPLNRQAAATQAAAVLGYTARPLSATVGPAAQ